MIFLTQRRWFGASNLQFQPFGTILRHRHEAESVLHVAPVNGHVYSDFKNKEISY
jgi:hypothetical protein